MVLLPPCLVLGLLMHFARPWRVFVQDNANGPGVTFKLFAQDRQVTSVARDVMFHYSVYDPSDTTVPVTEMISNAQQESVIYWSYTDIELPSITTHCIFYWATVKFIDFMDFTPSTTVGPCAPFHDVFSWEFEYGAVSLDTLSIYATVENTTNASPAITMRLKSIHPPYNVTETFKVIFAGQSLDEMKMNLCTDGQCFQTSSTAVQLNQTTQNVFSLVYNETSDHGVDIDVNGVVERWFTMDNQLVIGKLELSGFQVHRVNFTQHEYVLLMMIGELFFGSLEMAVTASGEATSTMPASLFVLRADEMLCEYATPNVCAQRTENATMVFSNDSTDHFHFFMGYLYHKETNTCYDLKTFGMCKIFTIFTTQNWLRPLGDG
uniref:uncharacterized protein n=1 Tax=Myxine glutinosa TaxID=7769 RepID=UPI00358E24F3